MKVPGPKRAGAPSASWAAICGLAVAFGANAAAAEEQARFALVAGNNLGGDDTRPLLYATEDARKVHAVLTGVGGVKPEDARLLVNAAADDFWHALNDLQARALAATRAGLRTTLIVYFSGHAKNGDLRMGSSRLAMQTLRTQLAAAAADVRIGIFDSCRSGAAPSIATRSKGARRAPAFDIDSSGAQDTRGLVILTSSGFDEDSQESDSIGGSYFSHHLASGMRGDADRSRDNRVTLAEAYAYAYARTVADTADSAAGAQHPTFSYDLKGNGDLVLTDLGSWKEGVYLPSSAPVGMYYLIDKGFIVAEVAKAPNTDRRIAMAPGRYGIKRRLADRLRVGELEVRPGQLVTLDEAHLHDAPFSDDPVKGTPRDRGAVISLTLASGLQSFFDQPTREGLFPPTALFGAELQVRDFFRKNWVWSADIAAGGARATLVRPTVTLPYRFGELALGSSLFAEWPTASGRWTPFFGARIAFLFMTRTFEHSAIPTQNFSTFSPGLLGGLRYRLGAEFSLVARARTHYLLYNIDANRSLGYWELALAMAYEF